MAKKLVLIGTGGMAREVRWVIEELNKQEDKWNILGWVSKEPKGTVLANLPVLGDDDWLLSYPEPIDVVVSVGDGKLRRSIVERLRENANISFPTIIATSAEVSPYVTLGEGSVVMNKSLLTVDIEVGSFFLCNYGCIIGHDCRFFDFVTINPGVKVSGAVTVGDCSTIGVGASIIQGITVGKDAMVGAGAVVIKDVPDKDTVAGVPAKSIAKA